MGSTTENSVYGATRNPWNPDACAGRLQRRLGGGRGGRRGPGRARLGHGRLDPPAGRVLRLRGAEAVLRARLALRADGLRLVPGPGRPADARRARCGAAARGDGRPGPAGHHLARRARAGLRGGPARRRRTARAAPRPARASTSWRAWTRTSSGRARGRRARAARWAPRSWRSSLPHTPVRHRHLLHHRHGRGLRQPGAVRRGALRRARGRRRPDRHVRPHAGRGFRRRGEAPHHPRHLRAEQRLLRRLLPSRPEGAHADPPRFRGGLRTVRRAAGARRADPGLPHGRDSRRSAADVPRRHLHGHRQPGRHLRPLRALRLRPRTGCRWGCRVLGPALFEERLLRTAYVYEQGTAWHEARPPGEG